jgi:hypothetical protein
MEIIQHIGAYAGLAAVVGLAVLSALYFSQARDVKRLREWAGRAPERTAEHSAVQRVTAQPQRPAPAPGKPAQPAQKPTGTPAVKPAPAVAAAGASPATAQAKTAATTPAAQSKQGARVTPPPEGEVAAKTGGDGAATEAPGKEPAPATATAKAGEAAAAQAAGAAQAPPKTGDGAPPTDDKQAEPEAAPAGGGKAPPAGTPGGPVPGGLSTSPPTPRPPTRPIGRPAPSQTAILPPPDKERRPGRRGLLASPRYLVLALAGMLIVGGAAAFGVAQLSKHEAPPPQHATPIGGGGGATHKAHKRRAAVNPGSVTVSVLNGTTVPGLAAQIGDKIQTFGFQLGNVTNSSDQQRAESVVMYAPGAEREGAAVGRKLRISQREPIDPQTQALAGDATVVVVTGGDQTQ